MDAFITKCDKAADATEIATPAKKIIDENRKMPGWLILRVRKTMFPTKKNTVSPAANMEINLSNFAFERENE